MSTIVAIRALCYEVIVVEESIPLFQQLSDDIDQFRSSVTVLQRDVTDSAS